MLSCIKRYQSSGVVKLSLVNYYTPSRDMVFKLFKTSVMVNKLMILFEKIHELFEHDVLQLKNI